VGSTETIATHHQDALVAVHEILLRARAVPRGSGRHDSSRRARVAPRRESPVERPAHAPPGARAEHCTARSETRRDRPQIGASRARRHIRATPAKSRADRYGRQSFGRFVSLVFRDRAHTTVAGRTRTSEKDMPSSARATPQVGAVTPRSRARSRARGVRGMRSGSLGVGPRDVLTRFRFPWQGGRATGRTVGR
jgi:hypothetical protein